MIFKNSTFWGLRWALGMPGWGFFTLHRAPHKDSSQPLAHGQPHQRPASKIQLPNLWLIKYQDSRGTAAFLVWGMMEHPIPRAAAPHPPGASPGVGQSRAEQERADLTPQEPWASCWEQNAEGNLSTDYRGMQEIWKSDFWRHFLAFTFVTWYQIDVFAAVVSWWSAWKTGCKRKQEKQKMGCALDVFLTSKGLKPLGLKGYVSA